MTITITLSIKSYRIAPSDANSSQADSIGTNITRDAVTANAIRYVKPTPTPRAVNFRQEAVCRGYQNLAKPPENAFDLENTSGSPLVIQYRLLLRRNTGIGVYVYSRIPTALSYNHPVTNGDGETSHLY